LALNALAQRAAPVAALAAVGGVVGETFTFPIATVRCGARVVPVAAAACPRFRWRVPALVTVADIDGAIVAIVARLLATEPPVASDSSIVAAAISAGRLAPITSAPADAAAAATAPTAA
jgi:hypothetical protein